MAETDLLPTPEHGWTCFHCGEHFNPDFVGQRDARRHFGETPSEEPACLLKLNRADKNLLHALRECHKAYDDLQHEVTTEDTALHREIARLRSEHATALIREEEKGYARGLVDAREYPETLGLARVAT